MAINIDFSMYWEQLLWVVGLLIVAFIVKYSIKRGLFIKAGKKHLSKQDAFLLSKLATWTISILFLIGVIVIFGGDIKNLWVGVAGILGLVAIGFVAVWSLLSNIFAGIIILLLKNIRIGDNIEIPGENISGEIEYVTLFYVLIKDKEGDVFNIPNNIFIQKVIKKIHSKKSKTEK